MKKMILFLFGAFAIGTLMNFALPRLAQSYTDGSATKLNDLQVDDLKLNGNDIVDSNETTRITVGATTTITATTAAISATATTVSGTLATTGLTTTTGGLLVQVSTGPRTNVTPTAAGQLIWNSTDGELCVSTGTAITSWVLTTDGSTACSS